MSLNNTKLKLIQWHTIYNDNNLKEKKHGSESGNKLNICFYKNTVPDRRHSYHHTALSEISIRITMHYFSFDVGFTNIVVRSTGQSGVETKYRVPTV